MLGCVLLGFLKWMRVERDRQVLRASQLGGLEWPYAEGGGDLGYPGDSADAQGQDVVTGHTPVFPSSLEVSLVSTPLSPF